jgi:hypothetical protein
LKPFTSITTWHPEISEKETSWLVAKSDVGEDKSAPKA